MTTTNEDSKAPGCKRCGKPAKFIWNNPFTGKPVFQDLCEVCNLAEKAGQERLENIVAARRHEEGWATLCPPLYRATDPARLPQDKLEKVLAWHYGPRGLLLHGLTGRYKTRAAWLLLRRLYDEGRDILAFDCVSFGHECIRRFCDSDAHGEKWALKAAQVSVLFLDDFDKFKFTERVEVELFGLIERRIANCLPIILTTNTVGDKLEAKMSLERGAPMVRRLREFCEDIAF